MVLLPGRPSSFLKLKGYITNLPYVAILPCMTRGWETPIVCFLSTECFTEAHVMNHRRNVSQLPDYLWQRLDSHVKKHESGFLWCRFDHIFGNFRTRAGRYRRIDLIISPYEEYPFCLMGWTGSRQYLRFVRQYAKDIKGMNLNSHRCAALKQASATFTSASLIGTAPSGRPAVRLQVALLSPNFCAWVSACKLCREPAYA